MSLVDPAVAYATCPMSNEVLVGLRGIKSIDVSRGGLRRAGVAVIGESVVAVDSERRNVRLGGGSALAFERLVVAPGIRFLWNRIAGYDAGAALRMPHAWKAGAQTRLLAQQLRCMDNGGVVAISVPSGLMRCPPGPYERASLIAYYLARHKPRSKVLIFDSNNYFPKQNVFTEAWHAVYPGLIDWIPPTQGGAVVRVDASAMTLYTSSGAHRVAVANVIPPQAPGSLASDSGLATGHGWCPVDPQTFESTAAKNVHVIGDACIAGAMPKSASAALSQARQCATAIAAILAGRDVPEATFDSVCYSMLTPASAIAFPARFRVADGEIVSSKALPEDIAPNSTATEPSPQTAGDAKLWYARVRAQAFAD